MEQLHLAKKPKMANKRKDISNGNTELDKPKNKRQRLQTRQWTPAETFHTLSYMRDLKINGQEPQQPSALIYYQKVIDNVRIPNCNLSQIRNKVTNMKKKYSLAIQWANQTGQGVDKGSVIDNQRKICPYFDVLDEIYGDKKIFRLPYIYCSEQGDIVQNNLQEEQDDLQDREDAMLDGEGEQSKDKNDQTDNFEVNANILEEQDVQIDNIEETIHEEDEHIVNIQGVDGQNERESIQGDDGQIERESIQGDDGQIERESIQGDDGQIERESIQGDENDEEETNQRNRGYWQFLDSDDGFEVEFVNNEINQHEERQQDTEHGTNNEINQHEERQQDTEHGTNNVDLTSVDLNRTKVRNAPSNKKPAPRKNRGRSTSDGTAFTGKAPKVARRNSPPRETISRFKKSLSSLPPSSNGFNKTEDRAASNAASVIAEALTQRASAMSEKNRIEADCKKKEYELMWEKFEFEKELRLREADFNEELRFEKLRQEERLNELRIRLEHEGRAH